MHDIYHHRMAWFSKSRSLRAFEAQDQQVSMESRRASLTKRSGELKGNAYDSTGEGDLSGVITVRYSGGMRINWISLVAVLWCGSFVTAGCVSHSVVPEALEAQLDKQLTFAQIFAAPESSVGKRVVVGGEVLKAKRIAAGTQLEVLQLPLDADYEPSWVRTESQGRFLAIRQEALDPATLTAGTRVTLVGELTGSRMDRLDDIEYRYPTFSAIHLYVWPPEYAGDRRSGVSIGVFGGMGGGGGSRGGGGFGLGY